MPGPKVSAVDPPGPHESMHVAEREGAGAPVHPAPATEQTSRIIVKNLPKHVDESRLREHFSAKGEVTDAKVMRTRDGKSRLFGFIGFSSAAEAQAAVKYFNRSFLDASRLEVEFAFRYGTNEKPRAWSKYTEGTTAHRRMVEATGANTMPLGEEKKGKVKKKKEPKPEELDPKLREFMAIMQPRSKQAIWANDDLGIGGDIPTQTPPTGSTPAGVVLEDGDGSDDELYEDLPGSNSTSDDDEDEGAGEGGPTSFDPVVADAGVSDMDYLKARMRRNFDDDNEAAAAEDELRDSDDENIDSESEGGSPRNNIHSGDDDDDDELEAAGASRDDEDGMDEIFGGKRRRQPGTTSAHDGLHPEDVHYDGRPERSREDPVAAIEATGRLFVRNLPYSATEDDLRGVFEPHGVMEEVHLVLDRATRRSKGYALIQFATPEDAVSAHEALDGSIFMGRLMHVLPGMKAPTGEATEGEAEAGGAPPTKGTSSYKRDKEAELKASAGNKVAWNSLFMRADTVAEAVAAHYGVSKADLLDPHAPDMAVRMALGETQVIAETKTALAKAGVDVEALEASAASAGKGTSVKAVAGGVARSDKILLVKNLPFSADAGELETLFGGIGPVLRLVLPPTRTLALVEYSEAQDARRAFKTLAYKRYQSVPIYLEWAPAGIFNGTQQVSVQHEKRPAAATKLAAAAADKIATASGGEDTATAAVATAAEVAAVLTAGAAGDDAVDSSTIYVKNLSFKTEEPALSQHFTAAVERAGGEVRAVKIAKKKTKDGRLLSSGFGFIECSSESVARDVIKALQSSTLDDHKLVLQLAQGASKAGDGDKKKSGAAAGQAKGAMKIVVRNLAFEAARKDILGLFTPFGAVKSCRLPRKFDGSHRGFAFVEFATPQEARSAIDAVSGTHLYGRRLVIEWAEEEGGLDELRNKTAKKFRGDEGALKAAEKRGAESEEDQEESGGGTKKKRRKK